MNPILQPPNAGSASGLRRRRSLARAAGAIATATAIVLAGTAGAAPEADAQTTAEPAPPGGSPAPGLRILAYNIHHGEGTDRRLDLERIAALIRREKADLVALQEVDKECGRSGGIDQAAELGRLAGMHHAFGAFMNYDGGEYGLAVLSRFPILEAINHRLPPGAEPRSALEVRVRIPVQGDATEDGPVISFVSVHLDWIDDDRRRFEQAQALVRRFEGITHPMIVAGDFNDTPGSRTIDLLASRWVTVPKKDAPLTWPSGEPRVEIDHVFVRHFPLPDTVSCRVVPEKVASDHRPVLADLPPPPRP